jgi:hypothetical protein
MLASPSIGTGVGHLVVKEAVVAWDVAPPGSAGRAEEMGGFTMGGKMIVPGAVGTTTTLFILVLC